MLWEVSWILENIPGVLKWIPGYPGMCSGCCRGPWMISTRLKTRHWMNSNIFQKAHGRFQKSLIQFQDVLRSLNNSTGPWLSSRPCLTCVCLSVRDLVLSCHLKPLEKKDRDGAPRRQPWNPVAPSNQRCPVAPGNEERVWTPAEELCDKTFLRWLKTFLLS